jgi:Colicin D
LGITTGVILSEFNSSTGSYFIGFNTNYRFASLGPSSNFEDPSYSYGFSNFSVPMLYPGFVNTGFYGSNTRLISNGVFITRRMGTGTRPDFVGQATDLGSELTSFGTDFKGYSSSSFGRSYEQKAQASKPKQLSGGISNTEEPSTGFGNSSFGDSSSSSGNTTLSINPDAQLKNDPHWGNNITDYSPAADQTSGISWNDPYRINGFQKALNIYGAFSKGVVDFSTGFNDGFRSSILLGYDPNYVPTDSTAYNFGRPVGDVAAGIMGIAEIVGGSGLGGGGLAACGTVLCPAGATAIAGGAALAGYGYGTLKTASESFGTDFTNLFAQENEGTGSAETGAQGGASSSGGKGSGEAAKGILNAEQRSLQHMFSRHAKEFGITSNWGKAAATEFEGVLQKHVQELNPIQGTYRGTQKVLHYFDPKTELNVMTDMSGNLVGGWKLSNDQITYLLSTGAVK